MKKSCSNQKGFTLIELLCAFAIISILSAFAVETFVKARQKTRSTICISNLREIGVAWQLYINDYNAFPSEEDILVGGDPTILFGGNKGNMQLDVTERPLNIYLTDNLQSGVELKIFHCPSDISGTIFGGSVYDELGTSYVANLYSTKWNTLEGRKIDSILTKHSRIILTGEIGWLLQAQSDPATVSFHNIKGKPIYIVVFLDAHADSVYMPKGAQSGSNWQVEVTP
ncbi:MAG: type II secretion system protein [Candidatus Theseobacter exili]|nr:type II secretion system protein [Candidatus Theseobacter exili]